ncbi:hypothetical protein [Ancylobacter terrae]|uniref:hypothetical protein n=1 Tax=Ancylobacter sp. sgz301288 TaxID=3342077 RepID=UPI003859F4A5
MNLDVNLEEMIAAVARGDFSGFDKLQTDRLEEGKKAARRRREERERLAAAAARLFGTPDGRLLLEWIFRRTLRRVAFHYQPGLSLEEVGMAGLKREGANELAFEILRLVAEGLGETLEIRT